jgi:succinoglycan biosynthesis protein ExoM
VLPQAGLAVAKAALSFGAALACVPVAHLRNRQALRGIMHAGVVSGLFGVREIRLYGDETAEGRANAA